jgi:iron(III) transport system ATP-binding protein
VRPKVLLFDEPLSNLDAKLRGSMRAEIRRIQRLLGITSLYVTHDQDEAMSMSDRIVVMHEGRIAQVGTPGEIYARPASVFVADFIGRANFIEVAPVSLGGKVAVQALGQRFTVASHPEITETTTQAYLVVRPETLTLTPVTSGGRGVVLRSTFHGHSVDYEVDTVDGTLSVAVSNPDPTRLLADGTRVDVHIDADRACVLPMTARAR